VAKSASHSVLSYIRSDVMDIPCSFWHTEKRSDKAFFLLQPLILSPVAYATSLYYSIKKIQLISATASSSRFQCREHSARQKSFSQGAQSQVSVHLQLINCWGACAQRQNKACAFCW